VRSKRRSMMVARVNKQVLKQAISKSNVTCVISIGRWEPTFCLPHRDLLCLILTTTMKDRAALAPDDPRNPWAWVYQECSGQKVSKPRRKAAKHIYADEIGDDLARKTNDVMDTTPGAKRVQVWQRLLDSHWKNLEDDRKEYYQRKSASNFEKEMQEYEKLRKKRSSEGEDPEDIQKCEGFLMYTKQFTK
jgi:hypothetical protein